MLKAKHIYPIIALLITVFSTSLLAQVNEKHGPFGGEISEEELIIPCEIHKYEDEMLHALAISREKLVREGILPPRSEIKRNQAVTLFQWPLKQANGFDQFSYYTTVNYVDLDPSGGILDYNCGSRTYDGHNGLDISSWPFWWKMMNDDQVEIIAAAPGTIVAKFDGNFDMNCSCTGSWNAVYVEHADGSTAWYGHMKTGSLTSKPVGATVVTGEFLGHVGSSGCSSNPHLHFEVRDNNNNVIEPHYFIGSCNNTTNQSWWASQKPYWEPTLNALMTHGAAPDPGVFCPNTEFPNIENNFDPGDLVRYGAYYHDQQNGDFTSYNVRNPNGVIVHSWNQNSPATYSRSWWWWQYTLPANAVEGTYSFNATYRGVTNTHYFYVGCPFNLTVSNEDITSDVTYYAENNITTSGTVSVNSGGGAAVFQAGNLTTLGPGLTIENGSTFRIQQGGCP